MYSKWLWVLAVLPLVTGWRWPGQARPSKPAEPTAEEQTLHQMRQDLGAVVKREPPRPIRMLLVPGGRVANCSATWGVAMGRLASDVAKVILLYPPSALGNQPGQQILLPDCQEIPTLAGKIAVEQTLKTRLMRESGQFQSITLSAQQLSCVSEPVAMLSLMLRPVQVLPMFLTNDTQLANLTAILTEILQDHQTVLLAFLDADDPRACSPQWTEQVLHSDIKQLPCSIQTMDALMPRLGLEVFPVSLAQMRLPENARQAVAESLLFIESATTEAKRMAQRAPAFIPPAEGEMLLHLARKVLQNALLKEKAPVMPAFAPNLQQPYGCQITLWQNGKVLAQSTTMAGDKPLLTNVVISTARFAVEDSVAKLTPEMLQGIRIEIGVISIPQEVHFRTLDELHGALRPGKHGLLVRLNGKEAGFIPAVWKQVPQPDRFVAALCRRLGQSPDALLGNDVRVRVFEMVTFREP